MGNSTVLPGIRDGGGEGSGCGHIEITWWSLEVMPEFIILIVVVTQSYTCDNIAWNYTHTNMQMNPCKTGKV